MTSTLNIKLPGRKGTPPHRRSYIGGSDARVIMGSDEGALTRLWKEKRGELEPKDLSRDFVVQLGCETEALNRRWFEQETGRRLRAVQKFVRHKTLDWLGATLDGMVVEEPAVFEAKFMLPWSFSEEGAAEKHMAQLQHNMLVTGLRQGFISIITGGGKWVLIEVEADPIYQTVLLQVEQHFWRCVLSGEEPRLFDARPARAKLPIVKIVDMALSNAWAEQAAAFLRTREAYAQHEGAKIELKGLVPEDAREAFGHGVRAKRSKSGAVSFEVMANAGGHHALQ